MKYMGHKFLTILPPLEGLTGRLDPGWPKRCLWPPQAAEKSFIHRLSLYGRFGHTVFLSAGQHSRNQAENEP